jgi:hypothetical protein
VAETIVDAIEIKCTLSGLSLEAAIKSFGLSRAPDKTREIWFFDSIDPGTGKPRLLEAGIILRLRRKKDGAGESTVKLRPAQAELLDGDFRPSRHHFGKRYSVEWDWAHDRVLAASMDNDVDPAAADEMVRLVDPFAERLSPDQLRLLTEAAHHHQTRSLASAGLARSPPSAGTTSPTAHRLSSARNAGPTATPTSSSSSCPCAWPASPAVSRAARHCSRTCRGADCSRTRRA